MRKISRRTLSLLLSVLFTVSLFTLPASAGEAFDEQVAPDEISEYVEKYMDELYAYLKSEFAALDEPEEGITPLDAETCSHSGKTYPISTCYFYPGYGSVHYKNTIYYVRCPICGEKELNRDEETPEPHTFSQKQCVGSNHSGSYTQHTYSYVSTCACGFTTSETIPAGCTPNRCVDPYSLTPPELDS